MKEAGNRSTVISIQQHKPTIENVFLVFSQPIKNQDIHRPKNN